MRRLDALAILVVPVALALACTDTSRSPVGADLLPGGIFEGGLQVLTISEVDQAADYSVFPAERRGTARLLSVLAWPQTPGFESRVLTRFSLSELDSLATDIEVLTAILNLSVVEAPEQPTSFTVHRVTAEWSEEAATWERRLFGADWATPGGDFDPVALAEFMVLPGTADTTVPDTTGADSTDADTTGADTTGQGSLEIPIPVSLVQEWQDGTTPNHGLVIVQATPGQRVAFASRVLSSGPSLALEVLVAEGVAAEADLGVEDDTFIVDDREGFTSGGLVVSGGELVRRAFVHFDVGGVPAGATIAEVQLIFDLEAARIPGDTLRIVANEVLGEFQGEETIIQPQVPARRLGIASVSAAAAPGDTVIFASTRLTRVVRSWLEEEGSNDGIVLTLDDESLEFGAAAFSAPRLRLVLIPPAVAALGERR